MVIAGAIDKWPAKEWTLENLCDRVGSNKVNVRVNTDCQEYKVCSSHLCLNFLSGENNLLWIREILL